MQYAREEVGAGAGIQAEEPPEIPVEVLCVPEDSRFEALIQPKGQSKLPLNRNGDPVHSHYQRHTPPLFWQSVKQDVQRSKPERPAEPELSKLQSWFAARGVQFNDFFQSITEANLAWGSWQQQTGKFWRCVLKRPFVKPSLDLCHGTVEHDPQTGRMSFGFEDGSREAYSPAIHSSSMYTACSILQNGTQPGEATKSGLVGVYCHSLNTDKQIANKSAGYSVSSELFMDGVYWTIKCELQVAKFMSGFQGYPKLSAGAKQWAASTHMPENEADNFGPVFHVTAVWIHALRWDQIQDADVWISFDRFHPEYEMVPETAP